MQPGIHSKQRGDLSSYESQLTEQRKNIRIRKMELNVIILDSEKV